jgi:hypothetical protein
LALLRRVRANVIGMVMNQVKYAGAGSYGYYYGSRVAGPVISAPVSREG